MSGRKQTSSHFKVKIKIQNDLTDHPSASQIDNKHIRIVFHSLKAFFSVLKCQISAVKILLLVRRPTPSSTAWTHSLFDSFRLVFRLVFRLSVNEDVRINFKQSNQCFKMSNFCRKNSSVGSTPHPLQHSLDSFVIRLVSTRFSTRFSTEC